MEQTYTEDGDGVPSEFMTEVGLLSYEPACIEAVHSGSVIPLEELLKKSSYSSQWLGALPSGVLADSAICAFSPNILTKPESSSLKYVGVFEYQHA